MFCFQTTHWELKPHKPPEHFVTFVQALRHHIVQCVCTIHTVLYMNLVFILSNK